jgi:hypothetical protein
VHNTRASSSIVFATDIAADMLVAALYMLAAELHAAQHGLDLHPQRTL